MAHRDPVVEVWVAPLVVPPSMSVLLLAGLAPVERARAGRFAHPEDARRFSVAHGWLRHVLGAACGLAPADVRLAPGPGKPRLEAPGGVHFNLSHAGDLALVAVADREVGVDVEQLDRGPTALEAVDVACAPAEADALAALAPAERAVAFLELWTAKEAYLKATGTGLTVAPDTVQPGPPEPGGARPVYGGGAAGATGWWVRHLRLPAGYVGAVAAEGRDWRVVVRDAGVELTLGARTAPPRPHI